MGREGREGKGREEKRRGGKGRRGEGRGRGREITCTVSIISNKQEGDALVD